MELQALAATLLAPDAAAIEQCVAFVLGESQGLWHGRARALMCRRLRGCALSRTHRTLLLGAILGRLESGNFSQQFKDQLRLALHLDRVRTLAGAQASLGSPRPHVRRYAQWVLHWQERQPT